MVSTTVTKNLVTLTKIVFTMLAAALFTFNIPAADAVASQATLSWAAPTNYAGGAAIQDFVGYNLYLGTASGSYTQKINVGNQNSYTVNNLTAGTTYYFALTAYDSMGNESGYSSEVTTSGATAPPATYAVTASAGTGGSITPSGTTTVSSGGSQSYTITPAAGYRVTGVTVDGASVGAVASYSFVNVLANHTIAASFAASTYTLTASAGTGGSITPSGVTTVNSGGSQTYTITPAAGYQVTGVTVDGASVGAVASYSFANVLANHTIAASFGAVTTSYSIAASAGTGGSISPAGSTTVNAAGSQSYTITPAAGYQVAGVTVDGAGVGAVSSYTFSNVAANHTIAAAFNAVPASYSISASAGTGGSISPAGTTTLVSGGSQAYAVSAAAGYQVAGVTVDGASVGAVSSYTFSNVAANHTIAATFTATGTSANIPHTGWTLKYVDSQELVGQNGAAANAFDGSTGTMWHTQWYKVSPVPGCPHEIQINLGKSRTLTSFSYLPRQDGGINGTIAKYEFYVSSDGINWGTPVATGTWANSTKLKSVSFGAKSGQYIRLRALSEVNGGPWTSAAEINVSGY